MIKFKIVFYVCGIFFYMLIFILALNCNKQYGQRLLSISSENVGHITGTAGVAAIGVHNEFENMKGQYLDYAIPRSWSELESAYNDSDTYDNVYWVRYVPLKRWERVVVPPGRYESLQKLFKAMKFGLKYADDLARLRISFLKNFKDQEHTAQPVAMSRKEMDILQKARKDRIEWNDGLPNPEELPAMAPALRLHFDKMLRRCVVEINADVIDGLIFSPVLSAMLGVNDTISAAINRGYAEPDLKITRWLNVLSNTNNVLCVVPVNRNQFIYHQFYHVEYRSNVSSIYFTDQYQRVVQLKKPWFVILKLRF